MSPNDFIDCIMQKSKGKITGFVVNYRAEITGEWREVIRYDTHHGRPHVHRYWRKKENQIEYLENAEKKFENYAAAYQEARKDIEENWKRYRQLYEKRVR